MKKYILIIMIPLVVLLMVGCTDKSKDNKEDTYTFTYKGVDITPGSEFKSESIPEEAAYIELPSCAFEGNDKVYTYEGIEVTSSLMKGKDTVYSVYIINDTVETNEGVKIADEKSLMIEKYGENYENISNKYTYTKGDVSLSFIVENDIITSIEYTYNSDNK